MSLFMFGGYAYKKNCEANTATIGNVVSIVVISNLPTHRPTPYGVVYDAIIERFLQQCRIADGWQGHTCWYENIAANTLHDCVLRDDDKLFIVSSIGLNGLLPELKFVNLAVARDEKEVLKSLEARIAKYSTGSELTWSFAVNEIRPILNNLYDHTYI